MHHRVKFHQNRSSSCGDISIFPFFQMAADGHLGFLNSLNFDGWQRLEVPYASLCKFCQNLLFTDKGPIIFMEKGFLQIRA